MHTIASASAALIVEDQPFVGLIASDMLREAGYSTLYAYDGEEALALLDGHPEVALLLTEASLPGTMDGAELCRRVFSAHPEVQLVVADLTRDQEAEVLPYGACRLRKPYSTAELHSIIRNGAPLEPA